VNDRTSPYDAARATQILPELPLREARLHHTSCFTPAMNELEARLARIETNLAHVEKQYEDLNQVVIEQARIIARLQKELLKTSSAVETMELERIRTNNQKPPHYQ
jgi:uncharacterized coiled-coil protein SlyX